MNMRTLIDLIESSFRRYASKPTYHVRWLNGGLPEETDIWKDPPKPTLLQVIQACHGDARAIIDDKHVWVWDQVNLYHVDAIHAMMAHGERDPEAGVTCTLMADKVWVKDTNFESDEQFRMLRQMIQSNPVVQRYYGPNPDIEAADWL